MSAIVLVACVGKKLDRPAPAKDLYQSAWFKKARRYAEKVGHRWYILSAKYGLVEPDHEIVPYNATLRDFSRYERLRWACDVTDALYKVHPAWAMGGEGIVLLGGKLYRDRLKCFLEARGYSVETPLEGLGIGQQLAWFDRNT